MTSDETPGLATAVFRNWWYLLLRGGFSVLFGAAALAWPRSLITALVVLFGAYVLIDGLIAVLYGFSVSGKGRVWSLLIEGFLGVLAGVVTMLWPDITALMLLYIIAAWAVVTGILELVAMAWLRRFAEGSFLLGMSGVFSVVLGVALFFAPQPALVALAWLLGLYALAFGALFIWLGLRLRLIYRVHGQAHGQVHGKVQGQLQGQGHGQGHAHVHDSTAEAMP